MAKRLRFIRDEILMIVGGAITLLGLLPLAARRRLATPAIVWIVVGAGAGVAMFATGLRVRLRERRLQRLLGLLHSIEHSSLRTLATTLAEPVDRLRNDVLFLATGGFTVLRYDPERDELYSPRTRPGAWQRLPGRCPTCLAPTPAMIPSGDEARCEYCRSPLPTRSLTIHRDQADLQQLARPAQEVKGQAFTGSWVVLIILFLFCWPAAFAYMRHKGLRTRIF